MNNRGYTLIELSVVVLLIGMMLLIAVPRVRDTLINDGLKAGARQLVFAARDLQNEAVREQTDFILHIDLSQSLLWSYPADATAEKRAELRKHAVRLPEGVRIASFRQADEAKKVEGEAEIRFFRRGYTSPAVIHLAREERIATLVFQPFVRTVTVYEQDVDFSFAPENHNAGL